MVGMTAVVSAHDTFFGLVEEAVVVGEAPSVHSGSNWMKSGMLGSPSNVLTLLYLNSSAHCGGGVLLLDADTVVKWSSKTI